MSKFNKSKDHHKSDGHKDSRPKNLGPAGFPMFEYLGQGKDHSQHWIKFKKNIKNSILQYKLDILLEQIIEDGVDPEVPELDIHALMKLAPSKTMKAAEAKQSGTESDSDSSDNEDSNDEHADSESESESDVPSNTLSAMLSKSKSKQSVHEVESSVKENTSTVRDNPLYEFQMSLFNEDMKTQSKARMTQVIQLKKDKQIFYAVMWSQCGLSMQNHIRSFKSFAKKHKHKKAIWLYKALEAAGCGVVALRGTTAAANTLLLFVGMHMSTFDDIHRYWERWQLAYAASIAAGNAEMSVPVLIALFNKSLHDGYAPYKADIENRKLNKSAMPRSLEDNFWQACNFVSATVTSSTESRAVFMTGDQSVVNRKKHKPSKPNVPNSVKTADIVAGERKARSKSKERNSHDRKPDPDWLAKQTCYGCRRLGHLVANCPDVEQAQSDEDDDVVAAPPASVKSSAKSSKKKGNHCRMIAWTSSVPSKYLLALDNCAYSSVLCNKNFASDIVSGECEPLLNWNGESHTNSFSGKLHPFGYCEINTKSPINLLSEFEVRSRFFLEDRYADDNKIGNPVSKIVHVGSTEVEFKLDSGTRQYVVDWREFHKLFSFSPKSVNVVISSVKQNEAMFSKDDVRRARMARELIVKSGYASKEDIMRLVTSQGNVVNIEITRADVQRAVDIYGAQHVLHGRSRIMRPDTRVLRAEPILKPPQNLYCDKFNVYGLWFMLCNAKPLEMLLVKYLEGQSELHLGKAFAEFVAILQSYKYESDIIFSDADSSAVANINQHSRVLVETSAAGDHVEEAESPIRTVKERIRSVKAGLDFALTKRLVIELVSFIVSRVNISISQHSVDGLCPRVRLTGVIIDAHKELRIGYGYLVVARNKNVVSNDALALRGEVCLTLRPVGNRQGSWRMMKLVNGKIVSRSQFKEVPMTDLALARLSELAAQENAGNPICVDDENDYDDPEDVIDDESFNAGDVQDLVFDFPFIHSVNIKDEGGDVSVSIPHNDVVVPSVNEDHNDVVVPSVNEDDAVPELVDDDEDDGDNNEVQTVEPVAIQPQIHASQGDYERPYKPNDREARMAKRGAKSVNLIAGRRISQKKRFNKRNTHVDVGNFNITHAAGVKRYGAKRSMKAQYKEVKSLYDNGTFEGVLPSNLSGSRKRNIIRSFIILREKFNAEGDFEKLKARLVANGAQMDASTHTDLSSPTVSLTFLLMMVVVAARERREVATMDIGSAFVKASMDGEEEVLLTLDQLSAVLLIKIDPSYRQFLNDRGEMVVKLKKALYGCLQSAKLWFELLVKELKAFGYEQNAVDPCVLNRVVDGKQSTLLLHVDDIMVLSEIAGESKELYSYLESKFGKVSLHEGIKHNYLGMTFDFSSIGRVTVTMLGYETDLVNDWFGLEFDSHLLPDREAFASTPATNFIFDKGTGAMLSDKNSVVFHSYVMRVAYLAKRVKPEISVAVSYMSTQVTKPNEDDLRKLDRAIRYVRDHLGSGITLIAAGEGKTVVVTAHIDASFGCHENGKSHTGVCISLGEGPVFVRSVKQKIVTKSSTEAELVALSDEAGLMFHIEDFVKSQGYECEIIVGQDNQSTITMVTTVHKESMRTRHIKVRYFWLRERIKLGELSLKYVPTGAMLADILTKPMQGTMFRNFVRNFCCRSNEMVPGRNQLKGV